MAKLAIDLRTDYPASQINHVDISIWDVENVNNPQYRILTSFNDSMDLMRGVRLNIFSELCVGHTYSFVVRMFFNEAPYVKFSAHIIDLRAEITAVTSDIYS
jgi:hypothetical protein|nr:hypothetical protein [uncultured Psychroserpens sp.]